MGQRSGQVAIAFSGWDWDIDEGMELRQLAAGLLEAGLHVTAIDRGSPRPLALHEGTLSIGERTPRRGLLRSPPAVLVVFLPFPPVQLVVALLLRLRGVRVVLVPMAWLGDDFVSRSWFGGARRHALLLKRAGVVGSRALWRLLASRFICASEHERGQAHLPRDRTVIAPFASPRSALVEALGSREDPHRDPRAFGGGDRPVALVARFDVYRKGIDRVCRWLEAYAAVLPRPALLLLAPADPDPPAAVADLHRRGLIEWDTEARGADLLDPLQRSRGVILLTRYEAYPRVLREAVLAGVPVLTTEAANFTETLVALSDDAPAGHVVEGEDVHAVQRAFVALADASVDPARAAWLLDRRNVGLYLRDVLDDVRSATPTVDRSYYAWLRDGSGSARPDSIPVRGRGRG